MGWGWCIRILPSAGRPGNVCAGMKDTALFYAREALRTAPDYGLTLEEAISHMLMNMLLPESAVAERMQHCLTADRLYQKLGDHTGRCYMPGSIARLYYGRNNLPLALAYNDSTILAANQAITEGNEKHPAIGFTYLTSCGVRFTNGWVRWILL